MSILNLAALILGIASGSADQPASTAVDPDQRMRCKTEEITGSLAGHRRVCHTVGEWRRLEETALRDATAAVDHGVVSCGECRGGK